MMFVDSLSPRVAELTLLSQRDWDKILSANSEQPQQAADTAAHYTENGLSGWSIPSETQSRRITETDPIHVSDGSSNARYLCEEAVKTFSFAENTNIATAGAKTK